MLWQDGGPGTRFQDWGGGGPKYTTNWLILPLSAIWTMSGNVKNQPRRGLTPLLVYGGQLSPFNKKSSGLI